MISSLCIGIGLVNLYLHYRSSKLQLMWSFFIGQPSSSNFLAEPHHVFRLQLQRYHAAFMAHHT